MNQEQQYRQGAIVVGPETDSQERLERAKRGLPLNPEDEEVQTGSTYADFYIDPSLQSYDPRSERKMEQHDPKPTPPEVTAESLLETWYVWQCCGRLKTVGLVPAGDDRTGVEEQLLASLYVESTPGFNRPILMHGQDHRGEPDPFRAWYGNWPDNRMLAAVIYASFVAALSQRLTVEPFVIYATNVRTPDHLEQAEAANDVDLGERNRAWRKKVA